MSLSLHFLHAARSLRCPYPSHLLTFSPFIFSLLAGWVLPIRTDEHGQLNTKSSIFRAGAERHGPACGSVESSLALVGAQVSVGGHTMLAPFTTRACLVHRWGPLNCPSASCAMPTTGVEREEAGGQQANPNPNPTPTPNPNPTPLGGAWGPSQSPSPMPLLGIAQEASQGDYAPRPLDVTSVRAGGAHLHVGVSPVRVHVGEKV
jgi:hypothetical protein